jgi:hypothetical protein
MQERKFTRYPTDIAISFKINGMAGRHYHYLKDASQGGLCFNALGCIKLGTQLDIKIPFPEEYCQTHGKIAWCQPLDNAQCILGIEFEKDVSQATISQMDLKH